MTTNADYFIEKLTTKLSSIDQTLKLIIHAGTPKTGTTSLQVYLDKKRSKLKRKGILYPNRSHNSDAPKHQWLEKNLLKTHTQNLLDNLEAILDSVIENNSGHTNDDNDHANDHDNKDDNNESSETNDIHTILLSTEGFYNCWWDFPEESKTLLSALNTLFDVHIYVWFRDPIEFAESFYKQCLRNPAIESINCYGKDLSFAEMLADPWFVKRLDYLSFINECESLFGQNTITAFEYTQDTVKTVSNLLGLSTAHDNPTPRRNHSVNALSSEILRVINRYPLSAKDKNKLMPIVHQLDAETKHHAKKHNINIVDDASKRKILSLPGCNMEIVRQHINTQHE